MTYLVERLVELRRHLDHLRLLRRPVGWSWLCFWTATPA